MGTLTWLLAGNCWYLMALNQILFFLRDKSTSSGWENTPGPSRNTPAVLALPWDGQGKANSPKLKALRPFSMCLLRDGPFLRGFLACGEEPPLWHRQSGHVGGAAPVPVQVWQLLGGCSAQVLSACSSCCIPHPESLSGNLQGSQCPVEHCQLMPKL